MSPNRLISLGATAALSLSLTGCDSRSDETPPVVNLTAPRAGSTTHSTTPAFRGAAGVAEGDSATVTVEIHGGARIRGALVQRLAATRGPGGSYSGRAAGLEAGTYTAQAQQADAAGNVGLSAPKTFSVVSPPPSRSDPVLVGAGDIASCTSDGDEATARLLRRFLKATIFALGDNAYDNGTPAEYARCYDPSWGPFKARTRPVIGGHDYGASGAQGFFGYFRKQLAPFGASATDPNRAYYSYDLGAWHVVVLNSSCLQNETPACDEAEQERWLRADLAEHSSLCALALYHDPRFSSGNVHGSNPLMQVFWGALYEHGVDLVLNGHEHDYERFAPQDAAGNLDQRYGVREIVVGTGGASHYDAGTIEPSSEVRNHDTFGVLELTLHPAGYEWRFVPEAGKTFTDSGAQACHSAPPPPPVGIPRVKAVSSSAGDLLTRIAIEKPAGTVPGDLLLAIVAHQGGRARDVTPPTDWTPVPETDVYEATNARIHAWYRVAGRSEPSSYTFTLTGGSGQATAGGILAVSGASATAPIAGSRGQSNGSTASTSVPAPSITTAARNTLLVYAGAVNVAAVFVPPLSMAGQWSRATGGAFNVTALAATQARDAPGPTGEPTGLLSTSGRSVAIAIAIAPK